MKHLLIVTLILMFGQVHGQENTEYKKPPQEILDLVDIQVAPSVFMDEAKSYMVMVSRNAYKSIAELSKEELRLGGLRIDPKRNIGSRTTYFNKVQVQDLKSASAKPLEVQGLPAEPRLSNFSWSPNQKWLGMTHTSSEGVELWALNVAEGKAHKVIDGFLNANMGYVINWFEDSESMLVKMTSNKRLPLINADDAVPTGPTISVNDGKKAQNRTYQDLLKNKNDEHNFEQLAMSELYKVSLKGKKEKWLGSGMYARLSFSPDGQYIMVNTVEKPFSYLVPYRRFPSKTSIYQQDGKLVKTVLEVPLIEDLPKGFMAVRTGRRNFSWRNDRPSTLTFVTALDGGDPEQEAEYRDELFEWNAPFDGNPRSLMKTVNRYSFTIWGDDETAIAYDYWWNTRNRKTYVFNPSDSEQMPKVVSDRNYQDRYSDPGQFETVRNAWGSNVLAIRKGQAFLIGDGYSDKGQFPFLDAFDLKKGTSKRLYQSSYTDKVEDLRSYDLEENRLLVRIESPSEYPNYYFRELKKNDTRQLTHFPNPFESIQGVHKEVIKYKRDDGIELSGTLYLPVGYDEEKKEKMPMILWAYPREYKDKSTAAQSTQNPNEFTFLYWGTMVYWVSRGYVVLDGASFPIVGEGDEEPNDSFRKQLVANARAAIDAVDELGYIDRNRVAVGGHSYGAFMVANLLSHSDLFAAGIARSGAYNRTLTPFGFQSEERSYWEAPEVYNTMSPFMHAEKMKTPLLLVHGEADNNSGTYPMQSERYFNALKGLGATVRLVILPKESHGYRGRESILHMLWEQDQWLEKHVKNRGLENSGGE